VGGSEGNFIAMMNAQAAQLGMTSSHFVNPNGMPEPGQYSTARDLAVLTVALRRDFPEYAPYFALEGFTNGTKKYTNYNLLIGRFDGADGMKTGFICASGFNQIGSATRGGRTVVAVVLGADSLGGRADQAAELLQLGLTKTFTGGDTLASLQPYGATRDQVADVHAQICNPKAAKVRSEGRDEEGKMKLNSPYIHEMDHDPRFVVADLLPPEPGSADNDNVEQGDGGLKISRIPIPQPRPLR
jgi:D-alanyl-D-alanine carboxypeptidase